MNIDEPIVSVKNVFQNSLNLPRSGTSSSESQCTFALLASKWFIMLFYFGWLTTLSSISNRRGMWYYCVRPCMTMECTWQTRCLMQRPKWLSISVFLIIGREVCWDLFLREWSCYSVDCDCDQDRLDGSAWLHTSRAGDGFARKCACNTDDFKYGKCKNVFLWISGLLKKQMHKVSTDMTSMANRPKQMPRHASGASILRRKGSRVCALTESKHSKARFAAKWT